MEPHTTWTLPKTNAEANRSIFFYKGDSVTIEEQKISSNSLIEALPDEDITMHNSSSEAYFLILEGKPINEPVVQHGPFVMNTPEEIRETMREYSNTRFGGWPWNEAEVVHPKEKGRFALHSDGTEEIK
jgi:redox-sensitive bicupin YhaK (pirin superfamily)